MRQNKPTFLTSPFLRDCILQTVKFRPVDVSLSKNRIILYELNIIRDYCASRKVFLA